MSDYEIRAVTKIRLDPIKEKDVIDEIESLVAHRKLGDYITNLLKFAAEHREDLEDLGFDAKNRGQLDTRKMMFEKLNDDIIELKSKVDAIFDMSIALKTAFEIGKVTGIEKQVDNMLAAQIVLQNQMNKLRRILGEEMPLVFSGIAGEMRKSDLDKTAKDAAELAVAHYGETLSELANAFNMATQQMQFMGGTVSMGMGMMNSQMQLHNNSYEQNLKVAHAGFEEVAREKKEEKHAEEKYKASNSYETEDKSMKSSEENKKIENAREVQFNGDIDALSDFFGM